MRRRHDGEVAMDCSRVELMAPLIRRDLYREADCARLAATAASAHADERVLVARAGRFLVGAGRRLEALARPRAGAAPWVPVGDPCLECAG